MPFDYLSSCLQYASVKLWIYNNTPDQKTSEQLTKQFLEKVYIQDLPAFRKRVEKVVRHAAATAVGSCTLERYLKNCRPISIIEDDQSSYDGKGTLRLQLGRGEAYGYTVNAVGQKALYKMKRVEEFVHELLHCCHIAEDPAEERNRHTKDPLNSEMDTREEEFTITGITKGTKFDYCCENTLLMELRRSPRINHRGVTVLKNGILSVSQLPAASSDKERVREGLSLLDAARSPEVRKAIVDMPCGYGRNLMHLAAKEGSVDALIAMLSVFSTPEEKAAAIMKSDFMGQSPLHAAAREGKVDAMHFLLKSLSLQENIKAALAQTDNDRNTLLHLAAQSRQEEVITCVLRLLSSPEERKVALLKMNGEGDTPMHLVAKSGSAKGISFLLEAFTSGEEKKAALENTDVAGMTALHLAAGSGQAGAVEALLGAFSTPEEKGTAIKKADQAGRTPLHVAAEKGDPKCIHMLLTACGSADEQKAAILTADAKHQTPLDLARLQDHPQAFNLLWQVLDFAELNELFAALATVWKKDISIYDIYKELFTCHFLECVVQNEREVCIKDPMKALFFSVSKQACIKTPCGQKTWLQLVLEQKNIKAITMLLAALLSDDLRKQVIQKRGGDGKTCLHYVAGRSDAIGMMQVLLSALTSDDAKKDALTLQDVRGETPLHAAVWSQNTDAIQVILSAFSTASAKIAILQVREKNGQTPLHYAAKYGDTDSIRLFLEGLADDAKKALLDMKDDFGMTPFDSAKKQKHEKACVMLQAPEKKPA